MHVEITVNETGVLIRRNLFIHSNFSLDFISHITNPIKIGTKLKSTNVQINITAMTQNYYYIMIITYIHT